jgi:hypothetical protein
VTTSSGRTRGRPTIFPDAVRRQCELLFPNVKTKRGQLDIMYRQRALAVLRHEPGLTWIFDMQGMERGDDSWRPTVLVELGKIADHDELKEAASEICRMQPESTRDAVSLVRQWRLGQRGGDPLTLANTIIHTINDYWKRFPKMTQAEVRSAVNTALGQVQSDTKEAP